MNITADVELLYDGQCSFCIRSLDVLRRFDSHGRLRLIDGNDVERMRRDYSRVDPADLETAMYAIADDTVHRGFFAFRRALWALPVPRLIAWLLYIPGVPFVGERVYAHIAVRRLFGCAGNSCSIPRS